MGLLGKGQPLEFRWRSSIHLRQIRRARVRPIREIGMVPPTRVMGIEIWVIDRPWVEVIDIIDFIGVLGKRTPKLVI